MRFVPVLLLALPLLGLSQIVVEEPWSHADVIRACYEDAKRQPANVQAYTRYLDLTHLTAAERQLWTAILSGHVNQLSVESEIVRPSEINGGRILRVNILDYGWGDVWESLADADPHYHARALIEAVDFDVRTEVRPWPGGVWPKDGKNYPRGSFTYYHEIKTPRRTTAKTESSLTDWTGEATQTLSALVTITQSKTPIVAGDWFIWQTLVQSGRKPGYYDFLGLKTLKDYERLVGFDAKFVEKSKRLEYLEAVAESGVSHQPRRIAAWPTVGGMRFWQTFDSDEATDKKNPLRVLDRKSLEYDASEMIGPLPNKLLSFFLADSKGNRQDSAPDLVGPDSTAHSNDGKIHVGLCWRCHTTEGDGLRSINGWVENLFKGPPLKLTAVEYDTYKTLRQQYSRELQDSLEDDRRVLARSVKRATGLTSREFGQGLGKAFAAYDSPVTLERAARMLRVKGGGHVLQARLTAYLRATGGIDPVLGVYTLPPERQRAIPIKQFHEVIPLAMQILKGYPR